MESSHSKLCRTVAILKAFGKSRIHCRIGFLVLLSLLNMIFLTSMNSELEKVFLGAMLHLLYIG